MRFLCPPPHPSRAPLRAVSTVSVCVCVCVCVCVVGVRRSFLGVPQVPRAGSLRALLRFLCPAARPFLAPLRAGSGSVCVYLVGVKGSTGHTHTHTHTPTENNTLDTHTTRTRPQTPKRTPPHKHLTTLDGGATTVRATSHVRVGGRAAVN